MTATAAPQSSTTFQPVRLWWISPVVVSLVVGVASITPAAMIGDDQFRNLWRTPKNVADETLLLFGCGAAALALGALIVIAAAPTKPRLLVPWPGLSEPSLRLLRRSSTILTGATLIGYAMFAYLSVRSGVGLSGLFSISQLREAGTIPGVTTLTQFGVPAVVTSTIVMVHRFSGAELFKVLLLIGLATVRAFDRGERLAVLELVVPIVVILAARFSLQPGLRRKLMQFLPIMLVLFVIVFFGVFEYYRSWDMYYRKDAKTSYTEFVLSRLGGYYATAANNGQLILDKLDRPNRLPFDTVQAIWTSPGIRQFELYERLGGYPTPYRAANDVSSPYMEVLGQFANQEFNSTGGYVGAFIDYGRVGGVLYFLLAGVVVGFLYCAFRKGKPSGLFFYPVIFLALVELPRYIYWAQGRSTYAWIGLLVLAFLVSGSEARHRHDHSLQEQAGKD